MYHTLNCFREFSSSKQMKGKHGIKCTNLLLSSMNCLQNSIFVSCTIPVERRRNPSPWMLKTSILVRAVTETCKDKNWLFFSKHRHYSCMVEILTMWRHTPINQYFEWNRDEWASCKRFSSHQRLQKYLKICQKKLKLL